MGRIVEKGRCPTFSIRGDFMTEQKSTGRKFEVIDGGNGKYPDAPPNPKCIEFLEDILQLAREGKIQMVFVVGQTSSRAILSGWTGSPPAFMSTFEVLGGIENAKMDFMLSEIDRRE